MNENGLKARYDSEADVLYVNLGIEELSVSDEISEDLVVDVGLYSGVLTGFRILSPHRKGLTIQIIMQKMLPKVRRVMEERCRKLLEPLNRKEELRKALAQVL